MIDFEHGAVRKSSEPQLAGFIAHAVMDHRDARAFSFLSGAAALNLEKWSTVIEAEVQRRRFRKQDLARAARRLRAIVDEDGGTPLRSWLVELNPYVQAAHFGFVRRNPNLQPQWVGLIEDVRSINRPLINAVARTRASLRVALMRVLAD